MKHLKAVVIIALFTIQFEAHATGSKQVPPASEKTIYETIVEWFS